MRLSNCFGSVGDVNKLAILISVAVLCTFVLPPRTVFCQDPVVGVPADDGGPKRAWNPLYKTVPSIADFVVLENGETIYVDRLLGACQLTPAVVPFTRDYLGNQGKKFVRIFRDPTNPENWLTVARSHTQGDTPLFVFKQNKERVLWTSVIYQEHDYWQFHQSKTGDLFAYTRDGFCYCFRDGYVESFEIPVPKDSPPGSKKFRPIEVAESEDGVVCFYSIVDPELKLRSLNDLLIYDKGWKLVELDSRKTGPAYFTDNQTVEIVTADRIHRVNVKTGEITEQLNTQLTSAETGKQLSPVKIISNGDEQPYFLWRHFYNSPRRYDLDRFKDGRFHRLATRKQAQSESPGKWELEKVSLDTELYVDHHSFEDRHGNWWVLGGGGFYCKSTDGIWKEFDFRYGIDTGQIDRCKVDGENKVWLFYDGNRKNTRVLDIDELLSRKPVSDKWKCYYVKKSTFSNDCGPFKAIGLNNELLVWNNSQVSRIETPEEVFPGTYEVNQDSLGVVWAFEKQSASSGHFGTVGWFEDGKWRKFEGKPDPNGGPDLTSFQVALQTRAEEGVPAGYWLGAEATPLAAFGPEKRVGFRTEKPEYRIFYFDGSKWHAPVGWTEFPKLRNKYVGRPFFVDGNLTAGISGKNGSYFQIAAEDWADSSNWSEKRPWAKIVLPEGRYPHQKLEDWLAHDDSNCPILPDQQKTICRVDHGQIQYVLSATHKAVPHKDGVWFMAKTDNNVDSELIPENCMVDPFGRWFVHSPIKWLDKYFVYEPDQFEITQSGDQLDAVDRINQALTIPWELKSGVEGEYLRMRYRLKGGIWSPWQPATHELSMPALNKPGKQNLEVEIFDPEMMRAKSDLFSYQLEVGYDLQEKIKPLIKQLSSRDFDDRNAASKKLVELGPAVLPTLDKIRRASDPETKVRAGRAAAKIREKWKIEN